MNALEITPDAGRSAVRRWALIAIGDDDDRDSLSRIVAECGLEPVPCTNLREARSLLASQPIHLVFCQDNLPGGGCFDLLRATLASAHAPPVIVCSRVVDMRLYLDVMEAGACDYMVSPYQKRDVQWLAEGALLKAAEVPEAFGVHPTPSPGGEPSSSASSSPEGNLWISPRKTWSSRTAAGPPPHR